MVFAQTSPCDVITTCLTLDEYRAMEETNPERHEYRNGDIITMSGETEAHSAIASNLLIHLGFLAWVVCGVPELSLALGEQAEIARVKPSPTANSSEKVPILRFWNFWRKAKAIPNSRVRKNLVNIITLL